MEPRDWLVHWKLIGEPLHTENNSLHHRNIVNCIAQSIAQHTVKARKLAYYGHTMRKQGNCLEKRNNARNNARCTQARKTTHGLDRQHQVVDRTLCGIVNQNDRRQRSMQKVCPWCGQPSDRGRLRNRTSRFALAPISTLVWPVLITGFDWLIE